MRSTNLFFLGFLLAWTIPCLLLAQTDIPLLSEAVYQKTSGATVKIVSDAGRKIGSGVIVGVRRDGVGFILTSYSMVAGRDKVAVILRNYSDALLGRVVDKWIDFDLDLAVISITEFPAEQPMVTIVKSTEAIVGESYSIISHTDIGDWSAVAVELTSAEKTNLKLNLDDATGCEGAPLVNKDGNLLGLLVTTKGSPTEGGTFGEAVPSGILLPILQDWFQSIDLQQKWQEKGGGFGSWIWAIGGGILGGAVATMVALSGGDSDGPSGLPRPPDPPAGGEQ